MFRMSGKTFRAKKNFKEGSLRHELHKKAVATLNSGIDLRQAVKLPEGEDMNEWLAVSAVEFFNRVNLVYGAVCDFCTEESCPMMRAGPAYEYQWKDDTSAEYKRPTYVSAPKYISLLMDWIEQIISDESKFPSNPEVPFPKDFQKIIQQMFRRLFRVFAHVYYEHFNQLSEIGAEAHINTCYKHFYYFATEFNLIPTKELEPLKDLSAALCKK